MFIEGEKTWWEPPKVRSLLSDEQELRYDKCRWMEPSEQRKEKRGEEIAFFQFLRGCCVTAVLSWRNW